jgi:hypothetical protein
MNTTNMNYYETSNNINLSKRITILEFICLISYLYIYYIIYKRTNAYFNKKIEEKKEKVEEVKIELKVEEKVELKVEEKVEEVKVEEVKVKIEEKDVNTWYKFEDGKGRYKGEWKNGMPNGKGIKHFYKDDSYIYGNFVDGLAEGYGKQTFEQTWEKTQPYYEGEFKRNKYDGKGEYHYGDGDYYKGMWKNNKYNGQGAAYSKCLDKTWVGEYKNDEKVEGNWVKGEI